MNHENVTIPEKWAGTVKNTEYEEKFVTIKSLHTYNWTRWSEKEIGE